MSGNAEASGLIAADGELEQFLDSDRAEPQSDLKSRSRTQLQNQILHRVCVAWGRRQ